MATNDPDSDKAPPAASPILNYDRGPSRPGLSILRILLGVELGMLLVASLMLDGGGMLAIVSVTSCIGWLVAGLALWVKRYQPTFGDRLCFIVGIAVPVVAVAAWLSL